MAPHRSVRLNPDQALHERIMREIALEMQDTPLVLKGGTALALLYGLDRHSVDLDFDCGLAKRVRIKNRVRRGLREVDVPMSAFRRGLPMWKGRRFHVHYINRANNADRLLKVELSFRTIPQANDIEAVDGIRTYKTPALFDQKMNAAEDRTKARDLYDLGFLAESYGDSFSTEQILRADRFSRHYKRLADRYRRAFQDDELLKSATTAEDRALAFRIAIVEQMHHRGQLIIEQSASGERSLADVLALHKIWLESDGQRGSRADLSDGKFVGSVLCGMNFERADLRRADFSSADLRNANLRNADLSGAVLASADLRRADFSGADLTDISMRNCNAGPATKGFAEALARVAKPDPPRYVRFRPVPRRTEPERDFGPSR